MCLQTRKQCPHCGALYVLREFTDEDDVFDPEHEERKSMLRDVETRCPGIDMTEVKRALND